jgi:hypothetical protein
MARTLADRAWKQFQEIHEQNAQETKAEKREQDENEDGSELDTDFYSRYRKHSARVDRENKPLTQIGQALRGIGEKDVMQEVAKTILCCGWRRFFLGVGPGSLPLNTIWNRTKTIGISPVIRCRSCPEATTAAI